jgi:hypothetical protein
MASGRQQHGGGANIAKNWHMVEMSSARVVVTIPPRHWFGGLDRRAAFAIMQQLQQRFGSTFYQFDTTPFFSDDTDEQQNAIANLRTYRPHLAISLSNANYGLVCAVKGHQGSANVFTDILNIPLMMLWDHGLFAFPARILSPLAERPEDSRSDALLRVSSVIDKPLMYHYPIDSGQVSEMRRIGMLHSDKVNAVPAMAYKAFLDFGAQPRTRCYINDVAFAGNVLLSDQYQPKVDQSVVGRCREAVIAAKLANPAVPAWKFLTERVEDLSAAEKAESRLEYDQSFFWHFANEVVGIHCNTESRIQTLNSLKRKVAFYGAFADPAGIPRLEKSEFIEYRGCVDFSTELPQVYAGTRILVDMTNASFINNCSTKPICCFASGGFSLFDYRPDPCAHLGTEIEKVMFKSFEELNAKIDYFLTHERERESLANYLKEIIQLKCNYTDSVYDPAVRILSERAGDGVWASLKSVVSRVLGGGTANALPPLLINDEADKPIGPTERIAAAVRLADVSVEPDWLGAKLLSASPMQIQTAEKAWGYSAMFPVAQASRRPAGGAFWIEVRVQMVRGRAGIGLLLDDYRFTAERVVGVEDDLCTLYFRVPVAKLRGVLVRSVESPSSILEFVDIALLAEGQAV